MKIHINGTETVIDAPQTVAQLLESMQLQSKRVAVERNRQIVAPEALAETELVEGDVLEIVHFVGGG